MTDAAASQIPTGKTGPSCPMCGKPGKNAYRPFCSRTCADIDLGRWLGGAYAIPTEEPGDKAVEE
ncbi:hypothetical protein MNBD_ALPHA09-2114 [hydrothermal vent metagenome]|uniref:DNA gyrase inhibitor YacG n=1 Tax=hydrothermal vent metagenome TaxID=652676 RepID=A0A3B0U1Y8_9ZZZZ